MTEHEWSAQRDGGLWRASCACGWRSVLCRYKSGAQRAGRYHARGPVTVTSRLSRMPSQVRTAYESRQEMVRAEFPPRRRT